MHFDFDEEIALRGTHSSKHDAIERVYGVDGTDVIAMWVADMDFRAAPPILAALQKEIDRGVLGYHTNTGPISAAVSDWYKARHGWQPDPAAVRYTHGVVSGYGDAIAAFSEPGDGVIVFSPVYHAFFRQVRAMGRVIVESPLKIEDGVFHMDLDDLAGRLTGRERLVTLCSPHNPGGRIWTAEELKALADFCVDHDLILISDEIHMDLCFPGQDFVPTAVAAPDATDRLVVLTAASKGFNIAGGETGLLIAPDAGLMARLDEVILDRESSPNRFGMAMTHAAFTEGLDWSSAVRAYLAENFALLKARLDGLPGVSVMPMPSTYLSWVDFTGLGMSDTDLLARIVNAGVAPNPGTQFGIGGSGHLRLNVALPRPKLERAIQRIEAAFSDVQ